MNYKDILVPRELPTHFYLRTGEPFHTVPLAKGEGTRPANVRDARKVGAIPSTTNRLAILSKPGLEAWKQEQAILAALTLPRIEGETDDAFAHRVVEDAGEQVSKAGDLGTRIHAAIEAYARSKTAPPADLLPYLAPFIGWFDSNVEEVGLTEEIVVNEAEGYAGKLDALLKIGGRWCLCDFKSQGCPNGKPNYYETWPLQLESYARALPSGFKADALLSVVIPTSPEHLGLHIKEYPAIERERYWEAFQAAGVLWTYIKGYDPRMGK